MATNAFVLPDGSIVELQVLNHDSRAHPFHLHGHAFQVVTRSGRGGNFPGLDSPAPSPLRRDTVVVYADGAATLRFRADNPGVQLFHCHTEWHVEAGLTATLIEAPAQLSASRPYVPASHRESCDKLNIPRRGNAAGNVKDWLNLTGQNTNPPANYWGALINPPTSSKAPRNQSVPLSFPSL